MKIAARSIVRGSKSTEARWRKAGLWMGRCRGCGDVAQGELVADQRPQERPQKNSHDRAMRFARVAGMFAGEQFYAAGKPSA
jgi:hypothetical protein